MKNKIYLVLLCVSLLVVNNIFACDYLTGGYENFVGTGTAQDVDGKEIQITFGGGNHGSGDDLGDTFPWASRRNGVVKGIGFNDMLFKIGNELYSYSETFTKRYLSEFIAKKLIIERTSSGNITSLSMNVKAKNMNSNEIVNLKWRLSVSQGSNVIRKKEGLKRLESRKIKALLTLAGIDPDRAIGLNLSESVLRLNDSEELTSTLEITNKLEERKIYTFKSFFGSLEKSEIDIYSIGPSEFKALMQYDYVALFPKNPKNCGDTGVVAYLSGLLNKNQSMIEGPFSFIGALDKFSFMFGSSGFMFDSNGKERTIYNVQRYRKFKNIDDVSRIEEMNFVRKSGVEYKKLVHRIGPGTFHRGLIEIKDRRGCVYTGMLETQTYNK